MSELNLFERAVRGEKTERPPIWVMRQAGRYLPEYRKLREESPDFISFCLNPEAAAEATLQPLRRFDLDAAIIFADILLIPYAMNRGVHFVKGEGPKMTPLTDPKEILDLSPDGLGETPDAVAETLERVREALPRDKAVLGFCGAPWTVATYMIEGEGSKDQFSARRLAWAEPEAFDHLMSVLAQASASYLAKQAEAGASALKIFESWAAGVPESLFDRAVIRPTRMIIETLRKQSVQTPIIGFPRGAGESLIARYADQTGADAIAIDQGVNLDWARTELQPKKPVQGNLDSALLAAGGPALDQEIDRIVERLSAGPHIFNLGHGITPQTPIDHMAQLVNRVVRGG